MLYNMNICVDTRSNPGLKDKKSYERITSRVCSRSRIIISILTIYLPRILVVHLSIYLIHCMTSSRHAERKFTFVTS